MRQIDQSPFSLPPVDVCPFCPDQVLNVTPTFPDGRRIIKGESVTFPNLYPFGVGHVVSVITKKHSTVFFSRQQLVDTFHGLSEALRPVGGYPSINWNFLPSAGASVIHPHMQGLSDPVPTHVVSRYLTASHVYYRRFGMNYWDAVKEKERVSDRYLFGDEIVWSAHAVPLGEREVRGIFPIATIEEFDAYIDLLSRGVLEVLAFFRKQGTYAFNLSLCFDRSYDNNGMRAFCSMISRINPTPASTSDSAFMERMHLEPVIMTLPEDLGKLYQKEKR